MENGNGRRATTRKSPKTQAKANHLILTNEKGEGGRGGEREKDREKDRERAFTSTENKFAIEEKKSNSIVQTREQETNTRRENPETCDAGIEIHTLIYIYMGVCVYK